MFLSFFFSFFWFKIENKNTNTRKTPCLVAEDAGDLVIFIFIKLT